MNQIQMTRIAVIILIAIGTIYCSKGKNSRIVMLNSDEGRKQKKESDSIYFEQEKKRLPSAIFDLLSISKDTLIAATRFHGIVLTANAGELWSERSNPGLMTKLTIDNQNQIWGLHSWQGIHEADQSSLYLSRDLGSTWIRYNMNTEELFPRDFYSEPRKQLEVIDYANRVFKLANIDDKLSWILVDSISKNDDVKYDSYTSKGAIKDIIGRRWVFGYEGIFKIERDTIKVY